jgi:uncharacterized membrane protein
MFCSQSYKTTFPQAPLYTKVQFVFYTKRVNSLSVIQLILLTVDACVIRTVTRSCRSIIGTIRTIQQQLLHKKTILRCRFLQKFVDTINESISS